MEEKINIAEILKDKKNGLRLYSPIFGECAFCYVREDTNDICVKKHNGVKEFFDSKGLYYNTGEVMLFPSKEMRDWAKFSWKKGDLLINSCGFQCIFKEWASDDYTKFNGCYSNSRDGYEDVSNAETYKFVKLDNNTAYGYVREIEKRCGGTLNLETLEIEKTQPEFKDGDIVAVDLDRKNIRIFKEKKNGNNICWGKYYIGFSFNNEGKLIQTFKNYTADCSSDRLATDSEKKQLFEALAKKGKAWDSEKKAIVDLKPKVELKPFDKVLSRRCSKDYWVLNFYSHKTDYYHICIDGSSNLYCIPYNEETAHLLGTTDEWKGGEQ